MKELLQKIKVPKFILKNKHVKFISKRVSADGLYIKKMAIRFIRQHKLFCIIVFGPILLVNFYSIVLQSPRYESYAVISIKQNNAGISSALAGSLLGSLSNDQAAPTQLSIDYIRSLSMYNLLDQQIHLSQLLGSRHIDFISRLTRDPNQKEIEDYYNSLLSVFYNSQSSAIEIKFQAFSPKEAQLVLTQIISNVQSFVNNLDQQVTTQKINFGKKQILLAHDKLVDAENKIVTFQNSKNIFDPKTQVGVVIGILGSLQSQLVATQTTLADKSAYYQPDSIEMQSLQQKIDTLKAQIEVQKHDLLGLEGEDVSQNVKLNQLMAQFEELTMEAKVAVAEYTASIQGLEMAKSEAIQQKQQVVIVEEANLPDYHRYPRIGYNTLIMFLVLLMVYGTVKMFMRVVEEHNY